MSNYWFRVDVDRVICRDTESLHSSDKLALSGALMTDTHIQGFVLPMIQINDGETRRYPDDLSTIFNGGSSEPRIGIGFLGWDLDQDDSWAENKEEIITVSEAISTGVKVLIPTYGPIAGAVLDGVIAAVPPIIDKFTTGTRRTNCWTIGKLSTAAPAKRTKWSTSRFLSGSAVRIQPATQIGTTPWT